MMISMVVQRLALTPDSNKVLVFMLFLCLCGPYVGASSFCTQSSLRRLLGSTSVDSACGVKQRTVDMNTMMNNHSYGDLEWLQSMNYLYYEYTAYTVRFSVKMCVWVRVCLCACM